MVVGLIQGVTELFPVSSLGHNVLIPALIGGSWAQDLSVSAPESPYLAFIVGLHVATAAALILYFWRDWVRLVGGFVSSLRERRIATADQRLAWMIILATIPVGIAGLVLEHAFRVYFSKPIPTAMFLALNGVILLGGERVRATARAGARRAAAVPHRVRPAGWPAGRQAGRPDGRAGRSRPSRRAGRADARGRTHPGDRGRPAAFRHGLRPGPADRDLADRRAAARHQPGRGGHGDRDAPRHLPRGRGPLLIPAVHAGDPRGRGAEDPRPDRPARQRHPRPGASRAACWPSSAPTYRSASSPGTSPRTAR